MSNPTPGRVSALSHLLASLARAAALPLAAAVTLTACHPQPGADFPEAPPSPPFTELPRLAFAGTELPALPLLATPAQPPPATPEPAKVRMWTDWQGDRSLPGILRSQRAHEARMPVVKALFAAADVTFPPAQLAFVVYKSEKQLEVWATNDKGGRAERVATYGICAASGELGPKRYEGDRQVPEGYYALQYGWAESNYHLEMKVSYPNMVDRVLGPKTRPLGGEIMIHGDCASIGCMAMGDERAEELWVMMKAMGDAQVKVHIYPARDIDSLLADPAHAAHHGFWKNLKEGHDLFEQSHRIPTVHADWHGVYTFE